MINIVIPMAGAGSRFKKAGYLLPKPLIPVNGVPMIRVVIENLKPKQPHRFIFICQRLHVEEYGLHDLFSSWAPGSLIIEANGLTDGAACTVLLAEKLINNEDQLMIANSDQYVDIDVDQYLETMVDKGLDGLIMTMKADDPKWSYVGLDGGRVSRVVEKEVISSEATVGIYNFRRGCDFVIAAKRMIKNELRVNGEFYVAPVYNQLIHNGANVGVYNIGMEANGMYGLGIPDDLDLFLSLPISKIASRMP